MDRTNCPRDPLAQIAECANVFSIHLSDIAVASDIYSITFILEIEAIIYAVISVGNKFVAVRVRVWKERKLFCA
jgi:hypothetical protein